MIAKYFNNGGWGFIDNIRQAANKDIDTTDLIKQYDKEVKSGEREDIASKDVDDAGIANSNKVFLLATEDLDIEGAYNSHSENLIDVDKLKENYPASVILLYVKDNNDYDALVLVTNQEVFLMNDKGQTIERLV